MSRNQRKSIVLTGTQIKDLEVPNLGLNSRNTKSQGRNRTELPKKSATEFDYKQQFASFFSPH